jgi:hypothetical protein
LRLGQDHDLAAGLVLLHQAVRLDDLVKVECPGDLRPCRLFKEFATQMTPTFPELPA